jgi:hypothetical protein
LVLALGPFNRVGHLIGRLFVMIGGDYNLSGYFRHVFFSFHY